MSREQVRDLVWRRVGVQFSIQNAQLDALLQGQVNATIVDQIGHQVWDQLGAQIFDQVSEVLT